MNRKRKRLSSEDNADDEKDLAEKIFQLYVNEKLCIQLGNNGKKAVAGRQPSADTASHPTLSPGPNARTNDSDCQATAA